MEKQTIKEIWSEWSEETFSQENVTEADFNLSNILAKQRQKENPIIFDFN